MKYSEDKSNSFLRGICFIRTPGSTQIRNKLFNNETHLPIHLTTHQILMGASQWQVLTVFTLDTHKGKYLDLELTEVDTHRP